MSVCSQSSSASAPSTQTRKPAIVHLVDPHDSGPHIEAFARAVRSGLTSSPKTLPWGYFYDEAGSRLFEEICGLPEYYLTRTEDSILASRAGEMIADLNGASDPAEEPTLIELGSGSATKTQKLIASGLREYGRLHYVPIDISPSTLEESVRRLAGRFRSLRITGYVADYRRGLERIMARSRGPRLIIFLGSSLGNYTMDAAAELLRMVRQTMSADDRLLLGVDMAKDRAVLEAAYDDARGVTAAFDLNLLRRINRELGADFQIDGFRHMAVYRPDRGRVEIHLVSTRGQAVRISAAGVTVGFVVGETIHTESSYKYTGRMLAELRERAGLVEEASWTDERGWFRLQRWRPNHAE